MHEETLRFIDDAPAVIGEGPLWSPREHALYGLDTVERKIMRYRPRAGRVDVRALPHRPSCIAWREDGRLLIAYKKGIGLFDFATGRGEALPLAGIDFARQLFNDGACDGAGRLWIGTLDKQVSEPVGALYCIERDGAVRVVSPGMVVSNGIAWSPDGRFLYHTDSRPGRIDRYLFDVAGGRVSERQTFLDYRGLGRRPDGCAVDSEGCLWVAEVDGARVARYTPEGRLDREIALPVSKPTSVAFGGDDMATLFITSMRFGLGAEALDAETHAGGLAIARPGVVGMVEHPARVFA